MNDRAKYLAVDEEKENRIQHLRDVFSDVYDEIEKNCKNSRETALVLTKLEEAQMWAIKGISREKDEGLIFARMAEPIPATPAVIDLRIKNESKKIEDI